VAKFRSSSTSAHVWLYSYNTALSFYVIKKSSKIYLQGNYEEDLYFAREVYEHEYIGGNKIERLNRPMTAPLKLKPGAQPLRNKAETPTKVSFHSLRSQEVVKARPQSALTQVRTWVYVLNLKISGNNGSSSTKKSFIFKNLIELEGFWSVYFPVTKL